MLQRLFRTKSAFKDYDDNHTKSLLEPESWSPTKLGEDQLRILICQDVGDTYKSVLYDSSQDVSLSPGRGTARGELARSWNGSQGFYTRPNGGRAIDRRNDGRTSIVANRPMSHHEYHTTFQHSTQRQANRRQDLIGDMIFGTAPLAYKGMNTKVHCKRDKEPQLVLSKVFTINPRDTDVTRRTSFSSVNSDWSTASSPVGAPYANEHTRRSASSLSVQLDDNVSELSSDDERCRQSPYQASPPTHHPLRSKRSCRFSQTSIENGSFRPMPLPTTPVFIEPGSLDSASTTTSVRSYSRNTKYALAIIITVDEKDQTLIDFIFSHFQLIENHLHHLQSILAQTLSNHFRGGSSITSLHHQSRRSRGPPSYSLFQNDSTLLDGISNFKRAFYDLYGIPRIQTPLWLNMCTFPQRKAEYAQALIRELIWLIDEFDNKAHHFIVSTCITAVLMYHLSWVHTVAPPEEDMTTLYQHGNYDPLWAQLSDLYGYVGTSTRITRTIVVGERASLVRRILFVLTYLIRCNEIYENIETVTDPVSPGNIFAREYAVDDKFVTRLEDRIARQLMGSTTDVESIAIPRAQHQRNDEYQPSESPESLADRSTSTSSSSTPNMTPAGQWSADDVIHERVDQPDGVAAASALLLPERQGDLNITMPSDAYLVPMLKSTVCRMTPDITRLSNDEGASIEPAHKLYAKSYGRSLMATYCDTYKSDFVLMGVPNTLFINQLKSDLERMLHQFSLSDSVNVATGLIIDTNICRCYALHQYFPSTDADDGDHKPSRMEEQDVKMSSMVRKLLLDMKKQNEEGAAADQLLDAFEDGLQLIYLKSLILHERLYLNDSKILFKDMEIDEDDIPLLAHVCSCYSRKTAEVLMNPAELKH